MLLVLLIVGAFLMLLGLFVGWSLAQAAFGRRARRQAALQRELAEGFRRLRALRAVEGRRRHGIARDGIDA